MLVDLVGENIEISGNTKYLKPRNISQLKFWGFSVDVNTKTISGHLSNLKKLLHYLSSSKISYSVTDNCQIIIDQILSNENDFNGSTLFFLKNLTAVGDMPKIVARYFDNIFHV